MAGLKEQERWEEEVYQIEENDPVHGGENGVTNKPLKHLANRTKWLKRKVETRATTEQEGVALLTDALDSDAEDLALTAKAGKALKALIDAVVKNLANYIPNSKKSNAVDSPSADTVATSAAVKTVHDKAVAAEKLADSKYTAQNATTTQRGLTQHYSGYDSDREDLSASAKVIKTLKGFIDSNIRRFDNYIPNSKKSSAFDSNSADTVATSAAVKRVYEIAAAAVPKNSAVTQFITVGNFRFALQHDGQLFIYDASNNNAIKWGTNRVVLKAELSSETNSDSQTTAATPAAVKAVNDNANSRLPTAVFENFRNKFTMSEYSGASSISRVYRIPLTDNRGLKIYTSLVTIDENLSGHRFRLAEKMDGLKVGIATGSSTGLETYNVVFENDASVLIYCPVKSGKQIVNLLLISEYHYQG